MARRQKKIVDEYRNAGSDFGNAVSYLYLGECIDFREKFERWEAAEQAYAGLGFRTLSIDDFVQIGGYSNTLDEKFRVSRELSERIVLHAAVYRERFLTSPIAPAVNLSALLQGGKMVTGTYMLPTTADASVK